MIDKNKILDDIARMAGSTVSVMNGLSQQAREEIKTRMDEMAVRLDLVPREDYKKLETMVLALRKEQDAMKKRLDALEGKKAPAAKTASTTTAKKPTTKKK